MSRLIGLALLIALNSVPVLAAEPDGNEFFEKRVRPILVENCYACHSGQIKEPKSKLRLDSRAAMLRGGERGPAIVPGDPAKSRLVQAISYKDVELQMPKRARLPEAVIADLTAWVKMGGPWPNSVSETAAATKSGFDLYKRKAEHWAWQPVRVSRVPTVKDAAWPLTESDRFILGKLEAVGLTPAPDTDRRTWLRRVTFDLTGLPPTPEEIDAFLSDNSSKARAEVVDRLLASPHFGERWARHWLDLVRYAESRGHEFDPTIPNAYQYRDYVIRALNADVPYNQFVIEHVAGDLLQKPRLNAAEGFNESILGTGFWFFNEETHSPVDTLGDQADRFDNRLDVFSKTFLGLTVTCARCHDHKFDAISQKDYYALKGFLLSSCYRQVRFDTMEQDKQIARQLKELREKYRPDILKALAETVEPRTRTGEHVIATRHGNSGEFEARMPFIPDDVGFENVESPDGESDAIAWGSDAQHPIARFPAHSAIARDPFWSKQSLTPGTEAEYGVLGNVPRFGRILRTPSFELRTGKLFVLVRGKGRSYAAVDSHTLIGGPLHGRLIQDFNTNDKWQWVPQDLTPYKGHRLHLEISPSDNNAFEVGNVVDADVQPHLDPHFDSPAGKDLAKVVEAAKPLFDAQEKLAKLVKWESRLAPAMWDVNGVNDRVHIRGSHLAPGEEVPRRFLEALAGPKPLAGTEEGSGRLALAKQMTDPAVDPFIARVFVNRVWYHLFGQGIVPSVDNLGVMGDKPTDPELLDYLTDQFVREGWSLKTLIRELVLSRTYGMSSHRDPQAEKVDPTNRLLHSARLRRLEGEAIRDAMLLISGDFNDKQFGKPVPLHLTGFLEGRGRPDVDGPLDGNGRRSIYIAIRRNFLSPFMLAFDTPSPFSTMGRRTVSNVPAQALILMNDPFVHQQAERWAKCVLTEPGDMESRIKRMYVSAFARQPTAAELQETNAFVQAHGANDPRSWSDLAHVLFNVKEFIYLP